MLTTDKFAAIFCITLLFKSITLVSAASCKVYTGNVCDKQQTTGVPQKYIIPDGKTQEQIDKEIRDALDEYPFKYIECKHYLKYIMCADKLRQCKKNSSPCSDSCNEVKKSICFKELNKDSKLYKWFTQEFICNSLPHTECKYLNERMDIELKEASCKKENEELNRKGIKINQMKIIRQRTAPLVTTKEYLVKQFPMYVKDDLVCHNEKKKMKSIITKKIIPLKSLVIEYLKERTVSGYCYCASTKTTIVPIAKLDVYNPNEPNTRRLFKHTNAFLVDRENDEDAFVTVAGTNSICLDYGQFHYSLFQDKSKTDYYHGVNSKRIHWKWIDQAEGNLYDNNPSVRDLMTKLKILETLAFHELTQIIVWKTNSTHKLFKDNSASMAFNSADSYDNYIKFKKVQSLIAISGNINDKSALFSLKLNERMKVVDLFWLITVPEHLEHAKRIFDINAMEKYLKINDVEIFFQMKSNPKLTVQFPKSRLFSEANTILTNYKGNAIVFKSSGKTLNSTIKPAWIDEMDFKLVHKLDENTMQKTIELDFQPNFSEEVCNQKQNQNWESFKMLLATIDYLQTSYYDDDDDLEGKKIKISTKDIKHCIVCCKQKKSLALKKLAIVFYPDGLIVDIKIVLLNKRKEIAFTASQFNLLSLFLSETVEIKRDYLKDIM